MAIVIREVQNVAELIAANTALGLEHYDEIALNKTLMEFAPDEAKFNDMQERGVLLTLAAFDGDTLVGYSVNIIANHLHYKNLRVSHNDMIYIAQSHRRGSVGLKLIRETQRLSKARGAELMLWHAKQNTPLAMLLPKIGCAVQDIIYSEAL